MTTVPQLTQLMDACIQSGLRIPSPKALLTPSSYFQYTVLLDPLKPEGGPHQPPAVGDLVIPGLGLDWAAGQA